jgi:beta-galactosidase
MKGSNYYIFTGGPNPDGIGAFGDVYDFQASISASGEIRPTYHAERDFGRFLKKNAWLAAADRIADFHIGLDWNHTRSKYFPACPEYDFTNHDAWTFFRKGMMITGMCASRAPNLVDLYSDDLLATTATPLLIACSVCMRADVQNRLIKFVQAGGRLLLAPIIPERDEDFQPCTILRDFLGATKETLLTAASPQLSVGPVKNVLVSGALWNCDRLPAEATVIAVEDRSGATCGWCRKFPKGGAVYWLGLRWKHGKEEHSAMLRYLLELMGVDQPVVNCDNPNVWTSLRSDGLHSMLFIMNLFSSPMVAAIQVTLPGKPQIAAGTFKLKPMEVRCVKIE